MTFLPMVDRELRLASRRPATYRLRWIAALVTSLVAVGLMLGSNRLTARVGHEIFFILSFTAFAYALLSGVRCTADCLSEEKRDGTLGLLFLTNLRGFDVVLGKLVVRSLESAYVLVATFPILILPVLLGAVTGTEFWRMNLLLVNVLFLSLVVGLLVSTVGRNERAVMLGTLFSIAFLTLGFPLLWKIATSLKDSRWWEVLLLFPSPAYTFRLVTDGTLRHASAEYWFSMGALLSVSSGLLVTCCLLLPRIFQEKAAFPGVAKFQERLFQWRYGNPISRRFAAVRQLEGQPFLWLLSRDRLPAVLLGLWVAAALGFAIWLPSAFHPQRSPATPIAIFGTFAFHLICKVLVTCEACRRLHVDKRSGALELLLSTPVTEASVWESQVRRIKTLYAGPFAALAFLNLMLIASTRSHGGEEVLVFFGGIVIALFDLHALTWVGMVTGLKEKSYPRAVIRALSGVMVLPWVVVLLFMFSGPGRTSSIVSFFMLWFLCAGCYDVALARWAKRQLEWKFRRLAADDLHPHRILSLGPPSGHSAVLVRVADSRLVP